MTAAKKFCVVKLYAPESRRSPYKVVPTFWIKNENNNVTVPYPPEKKLAQNFDRIYNCQLPLAEWEDYHVVIECEAGSSAEQSQTSRSSSSPFVDIDLENMTDSGSNNQPGRSPKNKKSAISKFFIRLSLSKKQQNGLNTPLSEEPGTSKEGSTTMTHVNSSYDSVAHSDLSSESYYAAPRNSPVTSRDIPPDQSLQAKQHRLLRRLHSTLNEATVIVKEFCFVQA